MRRCRRERAAAASPPLSGALPPEVVADATEMDRGGVRRLLGTSHSLFDRYTSRVPITTVRIAAHFKDARHQPYVYSRNLSDSAFSLRMFGQIGNLRTVLDIALLPAVYFAGMESSSWRATLGKRALGIQVTDVGGRRIFFARAIGRYFAKVISSLAFCIGFLMAAFTEKKQALHDILAGTLVVKKL